VPAFYQRNQKMEAGRNPNQGERKDYIMDKLVVPLKE